MKLNKFILRKIIVAIFCLIIGTCVSYVMLNVYDPQRNSVKALGSVYMDLVCIIIMLVLIVSLVFDYHGSNRTTKLFACLLIATTWALFLDFLNWAFDGTLEFGKLTFWFTVGSLCMGSVLAGLYIVYLHSYMYESHKLHKVKIWGDALVALDAFSFVITFILAVTGTAFEFVDGHYKVGMLYDIVTALPVLSLLIFTIYIFHNIKAIGLHDVIAVSGYLAFMIAGALVEASYGMGTTYVSVTIADIFIYVMIQNHIITVEKRNVKKWMNTSNLDPLTGLFNRRAYEADIANLENKTLDDNFVYVSADVNSLKMVNDSSGHYAGDELLTGASECIKECFGAYGKIYRIGGDEFIALIHADENTLNKLKTEIAKLTESWSGDLVESMSISLGYAKKSESEEMSVKQMAQIADKRMYDAKNDYYISSGINRRKE